MQRSLSSDYKHIIFITLLILFIVIIAGGCSLKASNRKYNSAVKEYEKGEYENAAVLFEEAIGKNPDKAEFYIEYGFTLIQLSRFEEALERFSKVILEKEITMIKENNKQAFRGRGITYYCMQMYNEAINEFDLALSYKELPELDLDILSYKGNSLELSMRLEEALDVYASMIESNKKEANLYRIRGDLYRKLNRYEESLLDYNKALELKESDFNLYFGKYAVLKELSKEAEALETLSKAAELPVYTESDQFDLAKVHFYQGNIDTAKLELNSLIEKGFSEGCFFIGEIYISEGNYEAALNAYQRYIEDGNTLSLTLCNQILTCCLMSKDFVKAKEYLEKVKQMDDGSMTRQIMRNEIIYLENTGDFTGAIKIMEKYLEVYEDEEAYNDYIFLKTRVKEDSAS